LFLHTVFYFLLLFQDQGKSPSLAEGPTQVWLLKECNEDEGEDSDSDLPPDSLVTPENSPTEDTSFTFPDVYSLEPVNHVFNSDHSNPLDGLVYSSVNILEL
jgi:hypothetical protein